MKKDIIKFCKENNISEDQFFGKEKVGGDLDLRSLTSIPDGFNPTVGGYLDLRSLTSIPDGFNPTVGGDLYLGSLTSIPDGFNPTVGGYLYLGSLTSIPDGFNPTVGGDLYLSSLTSIPDGFNPTVGGDLYLGSLTSIPDGFNPTVGGDLYLGSLTSIPDGFNPTVGGDLYIRSELKANFKRPTKKIITPKNKLLFWQNGKYVSADRILTEVVSRKGNLFKVKEIHSPKEFYLVSNGEIHAHGETARQAKEDFRFKLLSEKLKSEPIKADTKLTVMYYRTLTGACDMGCRDWMQKNNIPYDIIGDRTVEKTPILAKDLIKILEKSKPYGFEKFKSLITF